jgi:hypothetical protein
MRERHKYVRRSARATSSSWCSLFLFLIFKFNKENLVAKTPRYLAVLLNKTVLSDGLPFNPLRAFIFILYNWTLTLAVPAVFIGHASCFILSTRSGRQSGLPLNASDLKVPKEGAHNEQMQKIFKEDDFGSTTQHFCGR